MGENFEPIPMNPEKLSVKTEKEKKLRQNSIVLSTPEATEKDFTISEQNGILYNKDKSSFIHVSQDLRGEVVIPNGFETIPASAFANRSNLSEIKIPISVNTIGASAFSGCTSLTIYADAESKPSGWASNWNPDNRPVYWRFLEYLLRAQH